MKIAIIIMWVIWAFLFLAWPSDMLVAFLHETTEATEPDANLLTILGFVGFLSLSFTFALKWFLLRFLVNPRRIPVSSPWGGVIFIVGSLMIWVLTKSTEIYGLLIFFGSESFPHYLAFWIPSFLVMIIHMPFLLDPRRCGNAQAEQMQSPNPR